MAGIILLLAAFCILFSSPVSAAPAPLDFSVNMSEATTVDTAGGTPRIAVNVGGTARYASYASGSGTAALVFTYAPQVGDLDLDGVVLTSPVDLNGGTMKDAAGNDATLTFTLPNTTGVKVDYPSLSMDFIANRYTLQGTVYNSFSAFLTGAGGTFSRPSVATYYNSAGVLQTSAGGAARFDHDPVTLTPKGLLLETTRVNYVQNSQFSGVTPGGPYTSATTLGGHWQTLGAGNFPTGSITVTGTGTANGVPYLDLRFQGTNSTGAISYLTFNTLAAEKFAAVTGDKSVTSAWMAVTSYSSTGGTCTVHLQSRSYTAGGAYAAGQQLSYTAVLPWQKVSTPVLTHGATAATDDGWLFLSVTDGATCDVTVRIGAVQVEKGDAASSYIPTTNGIVTRNEDIVTVPTGTWYNQPAGSFYNAVSWVSATGVNYPMFWRVDDTTNNNRWNAYFNQNTTALGVDGVTASVNQGAIVRASTTSGSAKIAGAQTANNTNVSFDGNLGMLDTVWASPPVTRMSLTGYLASRWHNNIRYYPVRIPDAQLQLITQ